MDNVSFFNPKEIAEPKGYSQVVEIKSGRIVFISGQVALDANGKLVGEDDFLEQADQVFKNLGVALAAVDGNYRHIVKMNHFFLDMANLRFLREVRDRYLNLQNPPASTAVEVSSLANPKFLLEIEAVALLPDYD